MIPTFLNSCPIPVIKIAGQRRRSKPFSKKLPPLTVLLPEDHSALPPLSERPNLTNIKFTQALPFAAYAQEPNCKIFKITWRELNDLKKEKKQQRKYLHSIKWTSTELIKQMARDVLLGQINIPKLKQQINPRYHDFLDECRRPMLLKKITEADIEKFLTVKPDPSIPELKSKLPKYLHNLIKAFLPQDARKLAPRRPWDYKIELQPGKDPLYQKTRPISPKELKCVRKWLDKNLEKGFIRKSKARCAAPLLLAAKPGDGIRIYQNYKSLNNITIKNRYPLPLIRETLNSICRAKHYTKLDIIAAFNNIRIAEGHE
jgi:hypothetical protein